jgi:hypothetical protein
MEEAPTKVALTRDRTFPSLRLLSNYRIWLLNIPPTSRHSLSGCLQMPPYINSATTVVEPVLIARYLTKTLKLELVLC